MIENAKMKDVIITLAAMIIIVLLGFQLGILNTGGLSGGGNSLSGFDGENKTGIPILGVRDTDVTRGSGPFLLIEYSDYECGFCQRFHGVAQQLVDEGTVTWVYRHLPLPFHETADEGARIADCVRRNKGTEAFWTYTDAVFDGQTPSLGRYRSLGLQAGLSNGQIDSCLQAGSEADKLVEEHMREADLFGINGTPGSFLVNTNTGAYKRVPGAFPLDGPEGDPNTMRALLAELQ